MLEFHKKSEEFLKNFNFVMVEKHVDFEHTGDMDFFNNLKTEIMVEN
jgi:hypothetical protein